MPERYPVIIAAFNEEERIGRTLSHLSPDIYHPIVTVNGSIDGTADVAKQFKGVTVLERKEQGKLPAIQDALHYLGKSALGNVLYVDADSYPVSPNWGARMTASLQRGDHPSVVGGLTAFTDGNIIEDTLRSRRRIGEAHQAQSNQNLSAFSGSNMATHFGNTTMLDEILALPHIWPGEDRAIAYAITKHRGDISYALHREATVKVSSRFYPSIATRIVKGRDVAVKLRVDNYRERAAPSAMFEFGEGDLVPINQQNS